MELAAMDIMISMFRMTAVLSLWDAVLIIISNTSVIFESSSYGLLYRLRDIKRGREERLCSATHSTCILFHHRPVLPTLLHAGCQ